MDGKLIVERNCKEIIIDNTSNVLEDGSYLVVNVNNVNIKSSLVLNDSFRTIPLEDLGVEKGLYIQKRSSNHFYVWFSQNENETIEDLKNWLISNPIKLIVQLEEPIYEEVTDTYGEPILLEGYDNSTIYIDSIIPPTATISYIQKIQPLIKQIQNNQDKNTRMASDINDDILPKMMDLDFEIMMKEMQSPSTFKMRGAIDMATMQERTYEMLKRLIKGKSLPEKEIKERVMIYLEGSRINEQQAADLMLYIAEVY